jgi:thioredoxin reductase (NADPH)
MQRVTCVRSENQYQVVEMKDGQNITCHVCLIATGVSYCKLDVPGADRLSGAGVYYGAALTEAMACANETVYIVGGANSAGQAAAHFARFAEKVHILVRADSLTKSMSKYLIDQIENTPNIVVETCTEIVYLDGGTHLESIVLNTPRGEETRKASYVFIFIGAEPKTDWLPDTVARDNKGFILAGPDLKTKYPGVWRLDREPYLLETSVPGIFVAGDVRYNSVKRCASAVGEGSIAIQFVHQYLATL